MILTCPFISACYYKYTRSHRQGNENNKAKASGLSWPVHPSFTCVHRTQPTSRLLSSVCLPPASDHRFLPTRTALIPSYILLAPNQRRAYDVLEPMFESMVLGEEEGQGVLDSQDSWEAILDSLPDDGACASVAMGIYTHGCAVLALPNARIQPMPPTTTLASSCTVRPGRSPPPGDAPLQERAGALGGDQEGAGGRGALGGERQHQPHARQEGQGASTSLSLVLPSRLPGPLSWVHPPHTSLGL